MNGNFLETSRKKLNQQFLFEVSLFSLRDVSFILSRLSLFALILVPFLFLFFLKNNSVFINLSLSFSSSISILITFFFLFYVNLSSKVFRYRGNYNDQNGKFYRSHANLEFRTLVSIDKNFTRTPPVLDFCRLCLPTYPLTAVYDFCFTSFFFFFSTLRTFIRTESDEFLPWNVVSLDQPSLIFSRIKRNYSIFENKTDVRF